MNAGVGTAGVSSDQGVEVKRMVGRLCSCLGCGWILIRGCRRQLVFAPEVLRRFSSKFNIKKTPPTLLNCLEQCVEGQALG